MDLFVESKMEFEKLAAGIDMPEDPNQWPQEVLQQLFKQAPFLSDFSPNVVMDKVEAEKGYGFGHVTISQKSEIQQQEGGSPGAQAAGMREIRVPVVIKQNKMYPLDLLVSDGAKMMPLTESRLRQAIFRPQAFDVTGKTPGDQSMIGQLYPPYRQNYGFGGGGTAMSAGMGKEGSALEGFLTDDLEKEGAGFKYQEWETSDPEKQLQDPSFSRHLAAIGKGHYGTAGKVPKKGTAEHKDFVKVHQSWLRAPSEKQVSALEKKGSIIEAIAPTMNQSDLALFRDAVRDPNTRLAYEKNAAATLGSLNLLLSHEVEKQAYVVEPTVLQVSRGGSQYYTVKTANHRSWDPEVVYLQRGDAIQQLGEKIVLAADTAGAVTVAEGADAAEEAAAAGPDSDMQGMGPVTEFGLYKVQTDDGQELVGYVIPNLIDIDGSQAPLSLFTNGSQAAIQGDIMGVPVQAGASDLPTAEAPTGYGVFAAQGPEGVQATIPMEIAGSFQGPAGPEGEAPAPAGMQATTFDGGQVEVSQQPNIQTVMAVDGKMLIPAHWQWVPLDKAGNVSLVGGEDEAPKEASAQRYYGTVEVVSGGNTFSFRGPAVEKLAQAQRELVSLDDAMFLLAGLGVDQSYGIQKLGEATAGRAPVQLRIGRFLKTAAQAQKEAAAEAAELLARMPDLRRPLFKEAAVITDPAAVDAVLSLGFINTENISSFISYLPEIEEAQAKLCELLLAARLGMSNIAEGALEKSIRATEEVIEGLKTLAFTGSEEVN